MSISGFVGSLECLSHSPSSWSLTTFWEDLFVRNISLDFSLASPGNELHTLVGSVQTSNNWREYSSHSRFSTSHGSAFERGPAPFAEEQP